MRKRNPIEKHILFAELLVKKNITGLSGEEQTIYDQLTTDDQLKESIKETDYNELSKGAAEKYHSINTQKARQKLDWKISYEKQKKKTQLLDFVRYAAAFIPPVILAIWLVYGNTHQQQANWETADIILPGQTKAQLYLSDGRTVELEPTESTELKEINDQLIINDLNGLKYHTNHDASQLVYNKVVTPVGGEYKVILADGTKVWLNALSEIRYPVDFAKDERKVFIKGEVYFEVAKDANRPFIVDVDNMEVDVLGTHFNVMAYPDEETIETTLVEGSVKIKSKTSGSSTQLSPGYQASFNPKKMSLDVKEVDVLQYTAWLDGKFIYNGNRLESIMKQLTRWYGIEVFYLDHDLKNYRFSARLKRYDELDEILNKLELTTDVKFEINEKNVIISHK